MVQTSVMFEILLYLHYFYFSMFVLAELVMNIYKMIVFPFEQGILLTEILIYIFLTLLEYMRIFFGRKGNLTRKENSLIASIILTIPSGLGMIYILLWQSYVLRLEAILCSIQLFLQALEFVCSILCFTSFFVRTEEY
uniref:Transmembrane protein 216 n=2 Tax=Cacopsylla melanoneura TaxID=428564 RepID=A0A8D9E1S7_9HEMI